MFLALFSQPAYPLDNTSEVYVPVYLEDDFKGEVLVYLEEPPPPELPRPREAALGTYTVGAGETLGLISEKLYGTKSKWLQIYKLNEDHITDPDKIFPGDVLKIATTSPEPAKEVEYSLDKIKIVESLVIPIVKRAVPAEIVQKLSDRAFDYQGKRVILGSSFKDAGLNLDFNLTSLELHIRIPPESRRSRIHNLGFDLEGLNQGEAVKPQDLSAFLNLYGHRDIDYSTGPGSSNSASFESAVNMNGYVLEGSGIYTETTEPKFQRHDVRLIKDLPEKMARVTAGDLNYPVSYYQGFVPVGGVSVTRNFALQPYKNVTPSQNKAIFLRTPSVVTVIQNGVRVRSFDLPAGNHLLENLPVVPGISVLILEIRDESGHIEYVQISQSTAGQLLKEGLNQFNYGYGYKSKPVQGDYRYLDEPVATVFHRYGLSNRLTLGASGEHDRQHSTASVEGLYSTFIGNLGVNLAQSAVVGYPDDSAQRLIYSYEDFRESNKANRFLMLSAERTGRYFMVAGNYPPNNQTKYALNGNYSQSLPWNINGSLFGTYKFERNDPTFSTPPGDPYLYGVSLGKGLDNSMSFSFTVTRRHDVSVPDDTQFELFFSWNFAEFQTISARSLSSDSSNEANYRLVKPLAGANRYELDATVRDTPTNDTTIADAIYTGNRGQVEASHTVAKGKGVKATELTSLSASTGIAYAGGHLGVGHTINDSFALVARPKNWLDQDFGVNPRTNDRFEAEVNGLGPAVLPNLASYQYAEAFLDNSEIKEGYLFDPTNYVLLPTYKSGLLLTPGTDSSVLGSGRLLGADGQPIGLIGGFFVDNKTSRRIEFFTNAEGGFICEGLYPGDFTLRLADGLWIDLNVQIPENVRGAYKFGDLVLKPRQN